MGSFVHSSRNKIVRSDTGVGQHGLVCCFIKDGFMGRGQDSVQPSHVLQHLKNLQMLNRLLLLKLTFQLSLQQFILKYVVEHALFIIHDF